MIKTLRLNPWPYAIIGYFIVFISAMATWVVVAVRNDMQLVRKDYYEHEIRYQEQLDSMERTRGITKSVSVEYQPLSQCMEISLPARPGRNTSGTIKLYRPSDSSLDRSVILTLDSRGKQRVPAAALSSGLWRVQISWNTAGEDFYFEQPIVIAPRT
jgi:hypothetical protein